ncbi:MAG: GAF domain-containing sensor histidine kinase [Cyanobacteria bacterium J06600_6]
MNQTDLGSIELMRRSSYHPHTQQQLPKNMLHPSCDWTANTILQMALNNSDGWTILSDLADLISDLLAADLCIVVATEANGSQTNQIGCGKAAKSLTAAACQQLSYLPIAQDISSSGCVELESALGEAIASLVEDHYPHLTWQGILTQFQQHPNGLILILKPAISDWTEVEQKLSPELVNAIAITISQAQLQHQSRTKSRYQNLLKNLSREISLGYQPQVLFQNCLRSIGRTLELDRALILMFKYQNPLKAKDRSQNSVKGTARITCYWSDDSDSSLTTLPSLDLKQSALCQQAWREAPECLYFDSDTAFPDLEVDLVTSQGNALLMMPIMGRQTGEADSAITLGLLVLQSNLPRFWSVEELNLIDWVTTQMSTAITHDRTLSRVQLIVDERTAQLQSSMDMQGKLSAKMRQHIQQLQRVNQLKDDFMNSMSHELKTPLTSMKIAIKMLRRSEISPEMREKYLDILEQEWNREYSLIKDLLTLQQVESGELDYRPQELDLSQTIADLSHSFKDKWQSDRDLNLICNVAPADLKIHTDADSLKHILQELLSNAGKYCDPSTTIKMFVTSQIIPSHAKIKQEEISISVSNIGAGITPEELPYIFDKFRRGQGVTDRAVPGTGLGLTLVQYLVEHLNGKIEVKSQPLDGEDTAFATTFTLKLPQIQPPIA